MLSEKLKKTSKTKIARTYSLALYEASVGVKAVDNVFKDIVKLGSLLKNNQDVLDYLENPLWKESDKLDVLTKIAKVEKLSAETLRCLEVVCQNHRVVDLQLILKEYEHLYYRKKNIAEVEVETVKTFSSSQDKKLKEVLENILNQGVVVKYVLNPSLLGGLRVKCKSKMFDDSLSTKLNYLENLMKGK